MVRQYLHAVPMKGGKLAIEQIHGLMKAGYEQNPEVMGFKIDPEISTKTSKIYVNPNTGEKVVVHRGTQGASDWLNNLVYAYGGTSAYKLTPRYSEAQKVQKKAEQKYGAENISTIGHSQGGLQAELLGGKSKEIITYNKATRPFSNAPKENQYDISTQSDIASKLNPFQQKGHKVILPSKSLNPISEHQLKALEHADKELIVGTGGGHANVKTPMGRIIDKIHKYKIYKMNTTKNVDVSKILRIIDDLDISEEHELIKLLHYLQNNEGKTLDQILPHSYDFQISSGLNKLVLFFQTDKFLSEQKVENYQRLLDIEKNFEDTKREMEINRRKVSNWQQTLPEYKKIEKIEKDINEKILINALKDNAIIEETLYLQSRDAFTDEHMEILNQYAKEICEAEDEEASSEAEDEEASSEAEEIRPPSSATGFKKGSPEMKAHMAKLRANRKPKKVIEGEGLGIIIARKIYDWMLPAQSFEAWVERVRARKITDAEAERAYAHMTQDRTTKQLQLQLQQQLINSKKQKEIANQLHAHKLKVASDYGVGWDDPEDEELYKQVKENFPTREQAGAMDDPEYEFVPPGGKGLTKAKMVKGSAEMKAHMARLRNMRGKSKEGV